MHTARKSSVANYTFLCMVKIKSLLYLLTKILLCQTAFADILPLNSEYILAAQMLGTGLKRAEPGNMPPN